MHICDGKRDICEKCLMDVSHRGERVADAVKYCHDAEMTGVFNERLYTKYSLLLGQMGNEVPHLSDPESYLTVLAEFTDTEWSLPDGLTSWLKEYQERKRAAAEEEYTLDIGLSADSPVWAK